MPDPRSIHDTLADLLAPGTGSAVDGVQRREQCDAVARALAEPDVLATARQRQREGAFDPPAAARADATPPRTPRPISIWRPRDVAGEVVFERPAPQPFGDHYADRQRIRARKATGTRRVCFFGESVAAGYLYAPSVTPAKLLEQQLAMPALEPAAAARTAGWEVIDLARTNERLASLVATLEASLQLDPDVLVIFAGNNWTLLESPEWSPYAASVRARLNVAETLAGPSAKRGRRRGDSSRREAADWEAREGHAAGRHEPASHAPDLWRLMRQAARVVFERAGQALSRIASIAEAASVPVVLVVPEVNLADWDSRQPVPWLQAPDDCADEPTMQWHRLCFQARQVLGHADRGADDGTRLAGIARSMLALDDGLCPTSFRLLAEAHRIRGDDLAAAEACRQEIAACHYATLGFLAAPQASPMTQALLRRAAAHHGFACVDLPEVFAQHTGSGLPGNRLFLDYCHLTSEGMSVAMAAAAAAVRRGMREGAATARKTGSASGQEVGPKIGPAIAPTVEATARLGAAIHCAHRLVSVRDPGPLLRRLMAQAIDASPTVIDAMVAMVESRTAQLPAAQQLAVHCLAVHCPAVMTDAQQRLHASDHSLGFQHGWRYPYLDIDVIEAVWATLEARADERAGAVRESLLRLALDRHGCLDLLADAYFLERPLERLFPEVLSLPDQTSRAFLRMAWPTTRFVFVIDQPAPVWLEITARQPRQNGLAPAVPARGAQLEVLVNTSHVTTLCLTEAGSDPSWQRHEVEIESSALRHGVNRLVLRWPPVDLSGERVLRAAVDRLRRGVEADFHPIFGEVVALLCGVAPKVSRRAR